MTDQPGKVEELYLCRECCTFFGEHKNCQCLTADLIEHEPADIVAALKVYPRREEFLLAWTEMLLGEIEERAREGVKRT